MGTNRVDLADAWRALAGVSGHAGWRTIALAMSGPHRLRAGRRLPGKEEAVLIDIGDSYVTTLEGFPQARGFDLDVVKLDRDDARWIALTRTVLGSLDLFAAMVDDLISLLEEERRTNREDLASAFLARIRAWQDFMRHGTDGMLHLDAEIGLFGELTVLYDLLDLGLSPLHLVSSWVGPKGGLQDFRLGVGALEVKATTAASGFVARISSLEQLDTDLIDPIVICGVRLVLRESGRTLPELVDAIREQIGLSRAKSLLEQALLHAGYLDRVRMRYRRRFSHVETTLFLVDNDFARLTRFNVPRPIAHARYDLDLEAVTSPRISICDALKLLGVYPT